MSNKRLAVILAAISLLAVGAGIFQLAGPSVTDYTQRHSGSQIAVPADTADWFQRHPGVLGVANPDLSDYYLRHPNVTITGSAGADDYFERHPDSLRPQYAVDLSDWFTRHPDSLSR